MLGDGEELVLNDDGQMDGSQAKGGESKGRGSLSHVEKSDRLSNKRTFTV